MEGELLDSEAFVLRKRVKFVLTNSAQASYVFSIDSIFHRPLSYAMRLRELSGETGRSCQLVGCAPYPRKVKIADRLTVSHRDTFIGWTGTGPTDKETT